MRLGATLPFLLLTVVILVPLVAHASGIFSVLFGSSADAQSKDIVSGGEGQHTVALLSGATNIDPNSARGGGDILIDEDGALVPSLGPTGVAPSGKKTLSGEISLYVVRPDDSLSQIASMFGVSVNTILWANDIANPKTIQPGDPLVILPVSGVRHVVKKGDTLKAIAQKYQGNIDDIVAYNRIDPSADLAPGATVVIPGGEVAPPPEKKKTTTPAKKASGKQTGSAGSMTHPVPGAVRTQGIHGYNGVDFGAAVGTPVYAAAAGEVVLSRSSGYNGGYGNYVVIRHANGVQTLYAHLSRNSVSTGDTVSRGQVIGVVGNTGRSTGAHLHFEVRGAKNPF